MEVMELAEEALFPEDCQVWILQVKHSCAVSPKREKLKNEKG